MLSMGKSTISKWPFSIAMLNCQRVQCLFCDFKGASICFNGGSMVLKLEYHWEQLLPKLVVEPPASPIAQMAMYLANTKGSLRKTKR